MKQRNWGKSNGSRLGQAAMAAAKAMGDLYDLFVEYEKNLKKFDDEEKI